MRPLFDDLYMTSTTTVFATGLTRDVHGGFAYAATSTPSPSVACQNLSPSQLEQKLRDEGDFDHRYVAATLDDAIDRFVDLADAKFIQKAELYTCDAQCAQKTQEVRSTFAKYGQIPTSASVPDFNTSPSFADVRQVLEGHLTQQAPQQSSDSQWTAVFPDFRPLNPNQQIPPAPVQPQPQGQPQQQQLLFPPLQIDAGFPLAPPTLAAHSPRSTNDDDDDRPKRTPRPKARHNRYPQDDGFRWLNPGEWSNDSPIDSLDDTKAVQSERRRRAAPANSTHIGQTLKIRCSKKGEEEQSGLHLLCGACRVIRELPADFFPRYINEISCSGSACFDKYSKGGGRCVEQFLNFDIIRNVGTSDCQNWIPYTIAVPVCCSCLMSNALAQFLAMPWNGQTLTTSKPG